ncbi:MAG: flagellar hook-basal body protein [Deltaproteobacteria bacterium]|nr:flagellar hook-basal body protein [Deltaproteobacteria bacterium]
MITEMSYAVQGALGQEKRFETIANHLANVNTTGYKAEILSFDEQLAAQMTIDFTQGSLQPTGNPLDLAISGEGFFKIQTDQGIRYTRNGTFALNQEGLLVTDQGNPVLGENGPITIDGDHINITETGDIQVDDEIVGKLSLVTFDNLAGFSKQADSLFVYGGAAQDEMPVVAPVSVEQGALEQSNVQTMMEMTNMVETSRNYESYQKLIQTIDEMDAKAINEVGQVI